MELRQLRYFVAVATDGNISRAAKRVFLTQPALSRQIKALEEELGQCLLERQAHSIKLTTAGETLLLEASKLLEQAESVIERVRAAGRGPRLRVGFAPSLAEGFLPAAVGNFSQQHPHAQVELLDLSTQEILAGLESGQLDVALTVGPASRVRGWQWTPLLRAPWRLAVGREHPLAGRARVSAAEVAREALLVFRQRDYPEYWERVSAWLLAQGERPRIAGEYDGAPSLLAAVEAGLGVALVAVRASGLVPAGVRLKVLIGAPEPLCIAAGMRAERAAEQPLAVFLAELRRAAEAVA
jgi:DNA-binding transcriptional LysR family regulator